MPMTNAGRDFIASAIIGTAATHFDAANAYIGVGDSATAFSVAQTDLQAGANKLRKAMDAGFPTILANLMTFKSTYAPNEANFPWNEWAVFNSAAGGVMLNRVVEYNGTKLVGQTWIFEVSLTVNIGA